MNIKFFSTISISFLLLFSCDPFHTEIENHEMTVQTYEAVELIPAPSIDSTLKIVTWNIKFGGGRIDFFFDCHGDRVLMNATEVNENMGNIVAFIKHVDPDIIMLQEADIDAKRSAYVDQVQYILDKTDLNYGVYGSQWKADYIPNEGIGQMNSGNAILSKFPLKNAERIALPLIEEDGKLVQYFYLRRNMLTAEININNRDYTILNTHTSAFSSDGTKKMQLEIIQEKLAEFHSKGIQFIAGGDFNNLPENSTLYCDFEDDACSEESDFVSLPCQTLLEELENMKAFNTYDAAIPQALYETNQQKYTTFTSDKDGFWNRKLDYLFTNQKFVENAGIVHQDVSTGGFETMPLSDHAPVSTLFILD